ncbi:MAG TPA: asparaginase domain-containing protein [Clostridiales bacterium]|nr:asparaginase domain-containing protein [Clostridiales bacterium]
MSKHILFIETGGTFACETKAAGVRDLGDHSVLDFAVVRDRINGTNLDISVKQPFRVLSENMTLERLEEWLLFLKTVDFAAYDGVVIAHGTDTLAYTVNLTAFALGKQDIPLVFIAADRPLFQAESNGTVNFLAALDFMEAGETGVFALFRNEDGRILVHRGGRLRQMNDIETSFYSHRGVFFGELRDGHFFYHEHRLNLRFQKAALPYDGVSLRRGILRIFPYPGLQYSAFNLLGVDAVLLDTYHSATFCTAGDTENLNDLLTLLPLSTPIFIVGGVDGEERYAAVLRERENLYFVTDVAPEAFYMKALLSFGDRETAAATAYLLENSIGEKVSS